MNKNIRKTKLRRPEIQFKIRQAREENLELKKRPTESKILTESEKSVRNRCCLVRPKQEDFGHLTEFEYLPVPENAKTPQKHISLLSEAYGFEKLKHDSSIANTDFDNLVRNNFEDCSQFKVDFGVDAKNFVETSDGTQWHNIESISDLENFMQEDSTSVRRPPIEYNVTSQNIHIAEVPKVKIIAEKFSKFQRGNVELRRLDEKLVCVEYDIYQQNSAGDLLVHKPVQAMRAFFSIKPIHENAESESPVIILPSNIKNQFNIVEEDLNNLTQTGIEIIDDTIEENKSYLEDLKRFLKRAEHERLKKDRSTLDLKSLYEMAKREWRLDNSNLSVANFLSIKELKQVKDLILQQCTSSVHGISRKTMKPVSKQGSGTLSGCLWAELFKDNSKSILKQVE